MYARKSLGLFFLILALSVFALPATALGDTNKLTLDKDKYKSGDQIKVTFTAPSGLGENSWVGLVQANVPHGNAITNEINEIDIQDNPQYLNGQTSGVMIFIAPEPPPGFTVPIKYSFRMNDSETKKEVASSADFEVS